MTEKQTTVNREHGSGVRHPEDVPFHLEPADQYIVGHEKWPDGPQAAGRWRQSRRQMTS